MSEHQLSHAIKYIEQKSICVYQFGVFEGNTLIHMAIEGQNQSKEMRFFGFDSFRGFLHDENRWTKDDFNVLKMYNIDLDTYIHNLQNKFKTYTQFPIGIIPAYYHELNINIANKLKKYQLPDIIDIDCDLYSSTIDCLNWVFQNNLYKIGSIITYDEWEAGENRAHNELISKYNIKCNEIYYVQTHLTQKSFIIQ